MKKCLTVLAVLCAMFYMTGCATTASTTSAEPTKQVQLQNHDDGLVTYVYQMNSAPIPIPGKTAENGKYTFLGVSDYMGHGMVETSGHGALRTPQPQVLGRGDPTRGTYEGVWLRVKTPEGKVETVHTDQRIVCLQQRIPMD